MAMSKSKFKISPGTWIERTMFESKAYFALTGCAPQLLTVFLGKRRFETAGRKGKEQRTCVNADSLTFSYIEAKQKYGISKPRFTRGIENLLAKGFIKVIHAGGGFQKDKSVYGLSGEWVFWRPGAVFGKREKDFLQRGFCKPKKSFSTHEGVPIHAHESVPIQ